MSKTVRALRRTMQPRAGRQEPSVDRPRDYRFACSFEDGCAGLRAETGSPVSLPGRYRDAPSTVTMVGCVDGAPRARLRRWYREGSTPFSQVLTEAQSIGSPLPLPDAFSNRRVNDFDDRPTALFLCCSLAFRLHSKPYAPAFDDNRLAPFRSVEKERESLFCCSSCKSFHQPYYTIF